jgi:hypothetical protein
MRRRGRLQFLGQLFRFLFGGRRIVLLPIVIIILLVSLLAAVGALAPYSAFLYPL